MSLFFGRKASRFHRWDGRCGRRESRGGEGWGRRGERKREKDGERESIEYPRRLIEQTNRHCCFDYNPVLLSTSFISLFFLFLFLSFSLFFSIFTIADLRETQMEIGRVSRLAGVVLALISITWSRHGCCVAELYTALADMEELLETEAVLIDTLNGYIKAQEERLATLRKWVLFFTLRPRFYDCACNRIRAGDEPAFLNLLRAPIQLTNVTK